MRCADTPNQIGAMLNVTNVSDYCWTERVASTAATIAAAVATLVVHIGIAACVRCLFGSVVAIAPPSQLLPNPKSYAVYAYERGHARAS